MSEKHPRLFTTCRALRRHLPFVLFLVVFYTYCSHWLARLASLDLSNDEFQLFEHARSLIENGRFQRINIDPLFLPGLPRGAVFAVLAAAAMLVLGVTETAGRLPALLSGAACMACFYVICYRVTRRRGMALLCPLLLALTPLFIRWHFCCRFYTTILLFHVLTLYFFFRGVEKPLASDRETPSDEPSSPKHRLASLLWRPFRRFLDAERLSPVYLILSFVCFWMNLNQHLALAMAAFGLCGYGAVMLLLNVGALTARIVRRKTDSLPAPPLAQRFYAKYAVLTVLFSAGVALVWEARAGHGGWSTGIALLDQIPASVHRHLDTSLGQANTAMLKEFFPSAHGWAVCALMVLGVIAFWLYGHGTRYYGIFLGVNYLLCLPIAVYGWRRCEPRYGIFFLAMHVPLLAAGVYAFAMAPLGIWVRIRRSRIIPMMGHVMPTAVALGLLAALYVPTLRTGAYFSRAFVKPFRQVEYREGYGYLFAHLRPGDAVGFQFSRDYYVKLMEKKHGVTPEMYHSFSLETRQRFRFRTLAAIMREHPSGWLVWATRKAGHVTPSVRDFCAKYLTEHHPTKNNTIVLYSWNPVQTAELFRKVDEYRRDGEITFAMLVIDLDVRDRCHAFWSQLFDSIPIGDIPMSELLRQPLDLAVVRPQSPEDLLPESLPRLLGRYCQDCDTEKAIYATIFMNGKQGLLICQRS